MMDINWVPGITIAEVEKACILKAFKFYRGNKTQTANVLGICIRTLDARLEKYEDDERIERERNEREAIDRKCQLDRARGIVPQVQANGHTLSARIHVEPAASAASEHSVPVSQREEVQEVLPRQVAQSRKK